MLHAAENTKAQKKHEQNSRRKKRKRTDNYSETQDTSKVVKKTKWRDMRQEGEPLNCEGETTDAREAVQQPCVSQDFASVQHEAEDRSRLAIAAMDSWEVDSGFSSEANLPASGQSSPCPSLCPASVVALDCEMVGTGPGGRRNEVARCSIVNYHGNVLYDKYILPCQPVTNYRTRWSGIQRHHLYNATPFAQAREEILSILEGKVVVGHSIYNDFEVLDILHPCHMVRDTCRTHLLNHLAGFSGRRRVSLKILADKLLNRKIQMGTEGHCSVEDSRATLDLYKLVEGRKATARWKTPGPR
ncbi:hypothetical protein LDENG_00019980 [Lucifuga dentata]|nr:hypothetical protein LDENG_00019980 [Lucifuga dentata]